MGAVHLSVADLARSTAYYESAIGLRVHDRVDGRARRGRAAKTCSSSREESGARPALGSASLSTTSCCWCSEREDLARWLAHAAREEVPIGAASPTTTSARRSTSPTLTSTGWRSTGTAAEVWEGQVSERMTTLPLDVGDLLGVLDDPRGRALRRPRVGDGHGPRAPARRGDHPATTAFYCDALGFALMAAFGARRRSVAGGCHHHVGANAWESRGRGGAARPATLEQMTVVLPAGADVERLAAAAAAVGAEPETREDGVLVGDPAGNPVLPAAGPAA